MSLSARDLDDVVHRQRSDYLGDGLDALAELVAQLSVGVGTPGEDLAPLVEGDGMRRTTRNVGHIVRV